MSDEMDIFLDDNDFTYDDEVLIDPEVKEEEEDNLEEKKETPVEEKEVKKKQTDTPPDGSDKKDSTSNILSSIASVIQEEGYFELKEGETLDIKTTEDFIKVFDKVKETALQAEMLDWSDEQREYFEASKNGVPHNVIAKYQQQQEAYDSITEEAIEDEENELLRRQIITANLLSKNFSQAKAEKMVQKFIDSGEDVDEAKEALTEIKANKKAQFDVYQKQQKEIQEEENKAIEKSRKEFKDFVMKTTEVIPETKIAPKLKTEIYDGLTKAVSYNKDNQPLDIIGDALTKGGYEARFKLAYLIKLTDGLKNMDILSAKKAEKSTYKKLDTLLKTPSDQVAFSKDDDFSDPSALWENFALDD